MRQTKARTGGRSEKGSIAVETVFCLPILILFLVVPLFFARIFWYYSVAQKAAHDSARFLASAAQFEIMPPAGNGGARLPIAALAEAIAREELSDITPALERYTIGATCDLDVCGFEVPNTVRVSVRLKVRDEIFGPFTNHYFGEEALSLEARVTMRYVGN